MTETSSLSALPKAQPLVPAPGSVSASPIAPEGGFLDALIDTVNPLQHLPVVSSLYREASGDGISGLARIAGGALFGGIPGLITSAAVSLFDAVTGEDPGEMAISALKEMGDTTTDSSSMPMLDDGIPLAADSGLALVEMAQALQDAPPPPAPTEAAAAEALKIPGALASYRDESMALGFQEEGKREQYLGALDEIAMKM